MYYMTLEHHLTGCPSYWQNFIKAIITTHDIVCYNNSSLNSDIVNANLASYNGSCYYSDLAVEFDSEEDFIYFKLVWQ